MAEHYLRLSVDELIEDVLRHYRVIVWPKVEEILESHSNDASTTGIVLEGSGVRVSTPRQSATASPSSSVWRRRE